MNTDQNAVADLVSFGPYLSPFSLVHYSIQTTNPSISMLNDDDLHLDNIKGIMNSVFSFQDTLTSTLALKSEILNSYISFSWRPMLMCKMCGKLENLATLYILLSLCWARVHVVSCAFTDQSEASVQVT